MGGVQSPVLQAWSPTGSQAFDWGAHRSQALGLCARAAGPPIRVRIHPGFQVWAPRPLIRVHTHLWALGLCAQAACPLIWVGTDLGFRCVLGLLIWCSQVRG